MKNFLKVIVLPLLLGIILQACGFTSDTLYLQEAEVYGPINQPPVSFMNDSNDKTFSFSPKIYLNGTKKLKGQVSGHSKVNSAGIFAVDSSLDDSGYMIFKEKKTDNKFDFEGQNLTWHTPDYLVGFDLDYYMTSKFILSGGLTLSEVDNSNLFGWRLGVGLGGITNNVGIRFDAGLVWQEYEYSAQTVVVRDTWSFAGSSEDLVYYFDDRGKTTNLNHYVSINFHYSNREAVLNPFISFAYSKQKILDFEPHSARQEEFPIYGYNTIDLRGDADVSYLVITPGAYFHVNDWIKLVVSAKYFFAGNIDNVTKENFVVPTLQLEFML